MQALLLLDTLWSAFLLKLGALPRAARAAARHERSAKGHLGAYHGKLRSPPSGAGCAGHFASATSHRAKVPGRRGRECRPERAGPPGAPPPSGGAGPWAARHSNSHVASGEPTHQLNGAYSRTDAHPPTTQAPAMPRLRRLAPLRRCFGGARWGSSANGPVRGVHPWTSAPCLRPSVDKACGCGEPMCASRG